MARLTSDTIRIQLAGATLDLLSDDERDLAVEDALFAVGFRPLCASRVIESSDDEPPAPETPDPRNRPMQLLSLSERRGMGCANLVRTSPVPVVASVERNDLGTWMTLSSLFPDGAILRTVRRPEGLPAGELTGDRAALAESDAPLAPWMARFTRDMFEVTFVDRPAVGMLHQLLPHDASVRQALRAHEDRVMALQAARGEAVVVDDPELALALPRRSIGVLDVTQARKAAMSMRVFVGAGILRFGVELGALWLADVTWGQLAALWVLVELAGRNLQDLLMDEVGVTALLWWALLAAATWRLGAVLPVTVALVAHVGIAVARSAALFAIDGVGAARLAAGQTEPPMVPAAALAEHYPP